MKWLSKVSLTPFREQRRSAARWAYPAALALAGVGWYVSDSLRHRREGAFGYDLGTTLDVASPGFLRAAEALCGAPISEGSEVELFVNGDEIFPAMMGRFEALKTLTFETYVYWRGDITEELSSHRERARAGEVKVLLDALGSAQMASARSIARARRARRFIASGHSPVHDRRLEPLAPPGAGRRRTVGMTGGVASPRSGRRRRGSDHWRDTTCASKGPSFATSRAASPSTGSRRRARSSRARSTCPTSSRDRRRQGPTRALQVRRR